jgi:hypothetical protein
MKVVITQQFKYSPNGYDVVTLEPADAPVEVPDEFARMAVESGAAKAPTAPKKAK